MKSSTVDMDYNFLKSVQKSRDRGVEIIKSEAVNSRRKVALANRKRAIARAQEGGVNIRQLPKGMERMRSNQITWDSKYVIHKVLLMVDCDV